MEVVVGTGQANLDTEEVRGSSPPGPTIHLLRQDSVGVRRPT